MKLKPEKNKPPLPLVNRLPKTERKYATADFSFLPKQN
jgi:hypothetical protein